MKGFDIKIYSTYIAQVVFYTSTAQSTAKNTFWQFSRINKNRSSLKACF